MNLDEFMPRIQILLQDIPDDRARHILEDAANWEYGSECTLDNVTEQELELFKLSKILIELTDKGLISL